MEWKIWAANLYFFLETQGGNLRYSKFSGNCFNQICHLKKQRRLKIEVELLSFNWFSKLTGAIYRISTKAIEKLNLCKTFGNQWATALGDLEPWGVMIVCKGAAKKAEEMDQSKSSRRNWVWISAHNLWRSSCSTTDFVFEKFLVHPQWLWCLQSAAVPN